MAFIQVSGDRQTEAFPKKASTAIPANNALIFESGFITVAASTSVSIAGVSQRAIVSTDADYASTPLTPITMADEEAVFEADVVTGTLTTAMIGNRYDLANATGIDVTAQAHNQVTIVGFISATKALVKFNGAYQFKDAA